MARVALATGRRIGQGPRSGAAYIPAASVVTASLMSALPIVSAIGWFPDFGFLALLSWRLLRADAWPGWWAAPLGLVNDLFTGNPVGLSMSLWAATMLALDLIDRRTIWRDYWIEWALAGVFLTINELAECEIARLVGAKVPLSTIVPPILISIFAFPFSA